MAGNPSFDGIYAFTREKQIKKTWQQIWTTDLPFLKKIKADGLNYNTAEESPDGNSILFPLMYLGPSTSARVGLNSNAFTPITPYATTGFTQAQYFYARYENAFYLNANEKTLIGKADTTRVPILPGKLDQLVMDFKNVLIVDLNGTQNGTGQAGTGQPTGLRYFMSTSNSPGGVSQTTYPVWAAKVVTNAGPFYDNLVDREIHRIRDLGRGEADFCQLSYTESNDVYGKMLGLIAPSQILTDPAKKALYGFETFSYRGLDCFQDGRLGTAQDGSMVIGRSSAWYVNAKSDEPEPTANEPVKRLAGTTSDEHMFEWWFTWGTDDCAGNSYVTGIE